MTPARTSRRSWSRSTIHFHLAAVSRTTITPHHALSCPFYLSLL
jgi:hypothetical protein